MVAIFFFVKRDQEKCKLRFCFPFDVIHSLSGCRWIWVRDDEYVSNAIFKIDLPCAKRDLQKENHQPAGEHLGAKRLDVLNPAPPPVCECVYVCVCVCVCV